MTKAYTSARPVLATAATSALRLLLASAAVIAIIVPAAHAESLSDALGAAYKFNPRLDAEVQLVTTRRDLVVAAYTLLSQAGQLTADRLALAEDVYDPTVHYEEVRSKWFGLNITRADGRVDQVDVTIESDPDWSMDE